MSRWGSIDRFIVETWLRDMASHLIFGIPATIALFGISLIALRRTERAELAHAQLRQEVARRELTERALRQSQKMEAVGRLTGGIAHDFNNLLTAILGNVDLALRRIPDSDDRVRRLLNSARQASERAATLVQRLLAYSRQHPLEVKSVDINKLVQGMSELLRRTIGETITVETVLAGGLWKTAIDPNQLENAHPQSRDQCARRHARRRAADDRDRQHLSRRRLCHRTCRRRPAWTICARRHQRFRHRHDARGARARVRAVLHDQADGRRHRSRPEHGLRLREAIRRTHQNLQRAGEGTTIKLYFPRLADDNDLPAWQPVEIEEKIAARIRTISATRSCWSRTTRRSTALRPKCCARKATTSSPPTSAQSALRLLDANPGIKLLFTDVVLPGGMNGRQLADEALRRRPDLKVLYATGYTRNAIIHQGRLDADVELAQQALHARCADPQGAADPRCRCRKVREDGSLSRQQASRDTPRRSCCLPDRAHKRRNNPDDNACAGRARPSSVPPFASAAAWKASTASRDGALNATVTPLPALAGFLSCGRKIQNGRLMPPNSFGP